RAVRRDRPAVLLPHGGGGRRRLERRAGAELAALHDGLGVLHVVLVDLAPLACRHLLHLLLVVVDAQHVLHGSPPFRYSSSGRVPVRHRLRFFPETALPTTTARNDAGLRRGQPARSGGSRSRASSMRAPYQLRSFPSRKCTRASVKAGTSASPAKSARWTRRKR